MADVDKPEEFENFEDLTKRLLTVSKEDLDELRKNPPSDPPPGLGSGPPR